jgi:hypothetical protein
MNSYPNLFSERAPVTWLRLPRMFAVGRCPTGGSDKTTRAEECGISLVRRAEVGELSGRVCRESGQFLKANQSQSNLIKAKLSPNRLEREFGTKGRRTFRVGYFESIRPIPT